MPDFFDKLFYADKRFQAEYILVSRNHTDQSCPKRSGSFILVVFSVTEVFGCI